MARRKQNQQYTAEFKRDAVRLMENRGECVECVAAVERQEYIILV